MAIKCTRCGEQMEDREQAFGCEDYHCPLQEPEDIQAEIESLMARAETGEQWAEICRLEALMLQIAPMAEVADGFCNKLFR